MINPQQNIALKKFTTFGIGGTAQYFLEAKDQQDAFMSSYDVKNKRISFYGDNHPDFAGNVVRAMASAKKGYPRVLSLF